MWQSGGECEIKFIEDATVKSTTIKVNGKTAEVRVPTGLPSNTRPTARQGVNKSNGYRQPQTKAVSQQMAPKFQQMSIQQHSVKAPVMANNGKITNGTTNGAIAPNVAMQAVAKKKAPPPPPPAKKLPQCKALYVIFDRLTFRIIKHRKRMNYLSKKGTLLPSFLKVGRYFIYHLDDPGWWTGSIGTRKGVFPSNVRF
jgi:hypothetical protein